MSETQVLRKFEDKYYTYLNEIRESGVVNMFGAGEYLREEFELSKQESRAILADWMRTFGQ